MTQKLRKFASLCGVFLAGAIVLSGCAPTLGPITSPNALSEAQAVVTQRDGRVSRVFPVQHLNARFNPDFLSFALIGARNDPVPRVAALSETALLILFWNDSRYNVAVRIPYDGVVDIRRPRRLGMPYPALEIETTEPQHVVLGRPSLNGLFWVSGFNPTTFFPDGAIEREFYAAFVQAIRGRRPDWRPTDPPYSTN